MKILLAPDSFKESMTSSQVCDAMEDGIKRADPTIECIKVPMADGGEGTMEALVLSTGGSIHQAEVLNPLGFSIMAEYGILGDGQVAVIEMAKASGLGLIEKNQRNPLLTTTYGTGQLIKKCLDHHVKKILVGIGGSATNDGGAGMIQALGGKLMDVEGTSIPFGGGYLDLLSIIDLSDLDKRLLDVEIIVACDVDNPLFGRDGASYVYGPQKGADSTMVELLDSNLRHFNSMIKSALGVSMESVPGAGAAGGLGAGLMAFLDGKLVKGIDIVIEYTNLEAIMKEVDYVWTGEGAIDRQTYFGKTPYGVAMLAKKNGKEVIALTGRFDGNPSDIDKLCFDHIYVISDEELPIEEALKLGIKNIRLTSERIIRNMK